jgi:hypothetical protein
VIGIVIALTRPYMLTRNLEFMQNLNKKITESKVFEKLFGDGSSKDTPVVDGKDNPTTENIDYNHYRINFDSEYAIANPVTSHEGIDDLDKFRKAYNSNIFL